MDAPMCLVERADDYPVTRDTVSRLREELAAANINLAAFLEQRQATARRERELRVALHEAHEQLIRHDEELAGALQECLKQQSHWQETARISAERQNENVRLNAELQAAQNYIVVLTADRDALLARIERFRRSFLGTLHGRSKQICRWCLRKLGLIA